MRLLLLRRTDEGRADDLRRGIAARDSQPDASARSILLGAGRAPRIDDERPVRAAVRFQFSYIIVLGKSPLIVFQGVSK